MNKRHASSIHSHYRQSAARDYVLAAICNFLVGAMLGAAVTLGVVG